MARIYDLAKQFVRKSQGAAEQDVLEELRHAMALGSSYYILNGTGSSEPYGLVTALGLGGAATYTTAHTANAATLAGSVIGAINRASGALIGRERVPEAAVMSATGYAQLVSDGDATGAGFFIAGISEQAKDSAFRRGTLLTPFGIPVYWDNAMAADDLIVGEWSALRVYYGDAFRVDTSDQAGERWDKNLVGFRGEMEMGLDARPAVFAGAFQYVADVIP
jgi:HK97 family phage major capsid protein